MSSKKALIKIGAAVVGVSAIGIIANTSAQASLQDKLLFNTYVNGIDCSLMTYEQVNNACASNYYKNTEFVIVGRNGAEFNVTPDLFNYSLCESAESLVDNIDSRKWLKSLLSTSEYHLSDNGLADSVVESIINTWDACDEQSWDEPQDAVLIYDESMQKFRVVDAVSGTKIDLNKLRAVILEYILRGEGKAIELNNITGMYVEPLITSDNENLMSLQDSLNKFMGVSIEYSNGLKSTRFDAKDIIDYISISDGEYNIDFNGCATAFMTKVEKAFNSEQIGLDFVTSSGNVVEVPGEEDVYWKLDRDASIKNLVNDLKNKYSGTGKLVWEHEGAGIEGINYNNKNYVEVDLSNQKVYMYKNNVLIVESDVVSGNKRAGHTTPGGVFKLSYKTKNATLRGPGYASFVNFWMPFNKGIGLHDASWRDEFGGELYKTGGSHGCVNMPYDAAKTIYENIDNTFQIICYWRAEKADQL